MKLARLNQPPSLKEESKAAKPYQTARQSPERKKSLLKKKKQGLVISPRKVKVLSKPKSRADVASKLPSHGSTFTTNHPKPPEIQPPLLSYRNNIDTEFIPQTTRAKK